MIVVLPLENNDEMYTFAYALIFVEGPVVFGHERLNGKTFIVKTNQIAPYASLARAKLAQIIVRQVFGDT